MDLNLSLIGGWFLGLVTAFGIYQFWVISHCAQLLGTLVCR